MKPVRLCAKYKKVCAMADGCRSQYMTNPVRARHW